MKALSFTIVAGDNVNISTDALVRQYDECVWNEYVWSAVVLGLYDTVILDDRSALEGNVRASGATVRLWCNSLYPGCLSRLGDLLGATFCGGTRKYAFFYTGNLHYSVLQSVFKFVIWLHYGCAQNIDANHSFRPRMAVDPALIASHDVFRVPLCK